jgi:tRNA (uracil-5-)-methyltransferase TRM9
VRPELLQQLLDLNQTFYDSLAEPFARSRAAPQPGFLRLAEALPQPCPRLLDVGCGDGRFGRFLLAQAAIQQYTGVDFSRALLAQAEEMTTGNFYQRDLSRPGCLDGLGLFEGIACLATLQHIPGHDNRTRLLAEMKAHLVPDGRLLLATWQFLTSERQRRKLVPWEAIGLDAADLEPGDYLLTWQRGGFGLRYVALIDATATAELAQAAGLRILSQFRSDGREGNLSLYTVLVG